jgi:hypothetical protein
MHKINKNIVYPKMEKCVYSIMATKNIIHHPKNEEILRIIQIIWSLRI